MQFILNKGPKVEFFTQTMNPRSASGLRPMCLWWVGLGAIKAP